MYLRTAVGQGAADEWLGSTAAGRPTQKEHAEMHGLDHRAQSTGLPPAQGRPYAVLDLGLDLDS